MVKFDDKYLDKLYSLNEISKITGFSRQLLFFYIKKYSINTKKKDVCSIYGKRVYFYLINDFKAKTYKFIHIPKKEKKPYFEFAYLTFNSKINKI